jgi:cell division protein FtsW
MKAMGFPLTEQPEAGKTTMPTRKVDILLLFAVTFLLCIGIGMVMSASLSTSQPFRLFSRQLISGVIALGVMIVVARIDYHLWFEWRLLL